MTAVLNWVKRNWLIVTMVAVMLIVFPAAFVAVEMMNRGTREAIESRASSQMRELQSVEKTNIVIAPLSPRSPKIEENRTLNLTIIEEYEAARRQIKSDAEAVVQKALEINTKSDVLVPELLPEPPPAKREDLPYQIHDKYVTAHEQMLDELNAGAPPDSTEVATQLDEFQRTFLQSSFNVDAGENLKPSEEEKLTEAMTKQRLAIYRQGAESIGVYATMPVFKLEEWKMDSGKPSPRRMYDWQHTTWLHSDIVDAIKAANSDADGVPSAAVKRIVRIERGELTGPKPGRPLAAASSSSSGPSERGGRSSRGMEGGEYSPEFSGGGDFGSWMIPDEEPVAGPAVTLANPDAAVAFTYDHTASLTGRTSTGLYDVRHVTVELIVDSRRIQEVLNAVNRTNFMTVLGVDVASVNVLEDLAMGYFYGQDPVVRLTLQIETLWFRPWTTPLMPPEVKTILGVPVEEDLASTDG